MRVYLKSGRLIKLNREQAQFLIESIKKGDDYLFVSKDYLDNAKVAIRTSSVDAIK